jgi:predicted signal transduction protein with EAL and GGDEF domain
VKSTIDLAHNMGLRAIAEGVETEEAGNLLASLGVDALQGYLIAPPLSVSDLDDWLRRFSERLNGAVPQPPWLGQRHHASSIRRRTRTKSFVQ